mgnify:CR=1 FL=1
MKIEYAIGNNIVSKDTFNSYKNKHNLQVEEYIGTNEKVYLIKELPNDLIYKE